GLRALKRIEEVTGFSFLAGRPGHVPPDSLTFALAVLHAGLIADPKPTMSELEEWLDELSFNEVEQVFDALRDALHKTVYRTRRAPHRAAASAAARGSGERGGAPRAAGRGRCGGAGGGRPPARGGRGVAVREGPPRAERLPPARRGEPRER